MWTFVFLFSLSHPKPNPTRYLSENNQRTTRYIPNGDLSPEEEKKEEEVRKKEEEEERKKDELQEKKGRYTCINGRGEEGTTEQRIKI